VQVDPIKPKLKPPGTKRLKLKCDMLPSSSAFKFNLRRYSTEAFSEDFAEEAGSVVSLGIAEVGRCRLNLSNPS